MAKHTTMKMEVMSRNKSLLDKYFSESDDLLNTIKDKLTDENEELFQHFCDEFLS